MALKATSIAGRVTSWLKGVALVWVVLLAGAVHAPALAQGQVVLGGGGLLTMPAGKPRGSIILMAGSHGGLGITADGQITQLSGNQLIRTRSGYVRAGYATLALDSSTSPAAAVSFMQGVARPVLVVGTSRAAVRMPAALSAAPDGLAITSGMLAEFQAGVGDPASLPPTLIVHHRRDSCRVTLPALVEPFVAWSSGRARVVWLDGGIDQGPPCEAQSHHGFAGIDGQVVGRVTGFAGSLRRR